VVHIDELDDNHRPINKSRILSERERERERERIIRMERVSKEKLLTSPR